jgi:hypothetical protein
VADDAMDTTDPWRAAQARRAAAGGGGFTAPRPERLDPDPGPDTAAGPASGDPFAPGSGSWSQAPSSTPDAEPWRAEPGSAAWFAPTTDRGAAAAPTAPADGLPGLTRPDRVSPPPTGPDDLPGPGRAAPGREGWARSTGTYTPSITDKGANLSIILGIIGLLICGFLLGPAAIVEGVKARRRIAASGGGLTGNARAIVGIVIGSVATFLSSLGILAIVLEAALT